MPFIFLGIISGILSGIIGIGGGVIIVPSLIYFFNFAQQQAQGTTLALLTFPICIFAGMTYFRKGLVDMKIVGLLAVGFIIGGFLGGIFSTHLNNEMSRKIFSIILVLIGIKMFIK